MTSILKFVTTTARGRVVNESHGRCRHPDTLVAELRARHAAGATCRGLAREFGLSRSTVRDWLLDRRRRPHARVIVKRRRPVPEVERA